MDKLQPVTDRVLGQRITVHLARDVAYDLNKMAKVTANVLGKLGCPGCHSGHILEFRHLEEFVVNAKTLEVSEHAAIPG